MMSSQLTKRCAFTQTGVRKWYKTRSVAKHDHCRSPFVVTKRQFDREAVKIHGRPLLDWRDYQEVTVITFHPTQFEGEDWTIQRIGTELRRLVTDAERRLFVLNLTHNKHIYGSALGMFVTFCRRVVNVWGRMVFCELEPSIRDVLAITKLNKLFRVFATEEEAVQWLQSEGRLPRENTSPFGLEL